MLRRAGRKTTSSPSIQKETRGRQASHRNLEMVIALAHPHIGSGGELIF
jgi:hypothetical protein